MSEANEWVRANSEHLQPGDERFVRGYDSFTAGLVLLQLNYARRLAAALFPTPAGPRDEAAGQR